MRYNALCSGCHSSHNSCSCKNHNSHQHHHKTSTSNIRYVGPKLLCTNVINCDDLTTIIEKTDFTICDIYNVLENKVDKIPGKGLSKNDFTDILKAKLDGVQEGAEANVNPDWAATSGDAQILNKPNTIGGYGIIDAYTKAQVDSGQLDNRYFSKVELDPLANPGDNVLDFRYYTKLQLELGELDDRYYTESELNAGQLDNRYFTETELNAGQLNNLYYTEAELNAGQLDNRYYTQAQINAAVGTTTPITRSITINGVTQDLSIDRTWTIDLSPYQLLSAKGQPNGYVGIDGSGNIAGDIFGTTAGKAVEGNDPRLSDARTPLAHTHAVSEVTGLQGALDGKAAASHTHSISEVTGLQSELDALDAAIAAAGGAGGPVEISDVTGLQTQLDNFVTLNTDQNITATKSISKVIVTDGWLEQHGNLAFGQTISRKAGFHMGWNKSGFAGEANLVTGTDNPGQQGAFHFDRYDGGTSFTNIFITDIYGSINTTGTLGSFSDIRLKENVAPAGSKLDDLMKLNVVNFNYKEGQGFLGKQIGFIAHEFEEVFPGLVTKYDTRKYNENNEVIGGFEDTKAVKVGMEFAILTKAIQEQQEMINLLKAELELLKQK